MAKIPSVGRLHLGSQGFQVSAQGLGCMGMSSGRYGTPPPEEEMIPLIRHAIISKGITFLDTSDVYGPFTNEVLVGKAIKGNREKVQLATKFGISFADGKPDIRGDPGYVRAACEASLKRLDVDCIDLYYQHRIDTKVPIEVTALPKFRAENLERNNVTFEKICEIASRKGCSPGQLALAWIHHQGNDVSPIPGTTKVKNLEENIGALSVKLTPKEMKEIENVVSTCGFFGDRCDEVFKNFTWMNSETPPLSSWKNAV